MSNHRFCPPCDCVTASGCVFTSTFRALYTTCVDGVPEDTADLAIDCMPAGYIVYNTRTSERTEYTIYTRPPNVLDPPESSLTFGAVERTSVTEYAVQITCDDGSGYAPFDPTEADALDDLGWGEGSCALIVAGSGLRVYLCSRTLVDDELVFGDGPFGTPVALASAVVAIGPGGIADIAGTVQTTTACPSSSSDSSTAPIPGGTRSTETSDDSVYVSEPFFATAWREVGLDILDDTVSVEVAYGDFTRLSASGSMVITSMQPSADSCEAPAEWLEICGLPGSRVGISTATADALRAWATAAAIVAPEPVFALAGGGPCLKLIGADVSARGAVGLTIDAFEALYVDADCDLCKYRDREVVRRCSDSALFLSVGARLFLGFGAAGAIRYLGECYEPTGTTGRDHIGDDLPLLAVVGSVGAFDDCASCVGLPIVISCDDGEERIVAGIVEADLTGSNTVFEADGGCWQFDPESRTAPDDGELAKLTVSSPTQQLNCAASACGAGEWREATICVPAGYSRGYPTPLGMSTILKVAVSPSQWSGHFEGDQFRVTYRISITCVDDPLKRRSVPVTWCYELGGVIDGPDSATPAMQIDPANPGIEWYTPVLAGCSFDDRCDPDWPRDDVCGEPEPGELRVAPGFADAAGSSPAIRQIDPALARAARGVSIVPLVVLTAEQLAERGSECFGDGDRPACPHAVEREDGRHSCSACTGCGSKAAIEDWIRDARRSCPIGEWSAVRG